MDIGKTIRLCRAQKSWTQSDLSKRTGITVPHLSMMENNLRDPSMAAMQALANAFDLPLNVLVFLASEPKELTGLSDELKEKLSRAALTLLRLPSSGHLFSNTPNRHT
jgi:transcriptional regulator with XRE-family HTH domain